jgi:hypothetical protein
MQRSRTAAVAVAVVVAPLLAACSGSSGAHTAVLGISATRAPVGCSGYFVTAGHTVTANLRLTGPVWSVTASARLADGATVELPQPVAVIDAVSRETLRLSHVAGTVTSVTARVDGGTGVTGTCQLSNPH